MSDLPEYVLERVFDARPKIVWRTWTEPELLTRWYGPNVETIVHRLELKPGGLWLIEMRWGGNSSYQRAEYTEVDPQRRLVWLHSNADRDWNIAGNPRMPDWPRVLLTTVTFQPEGEKTQIRLTWTPHEASTAEIACFAGALAGLDKGWAAGMKLLEDVIAEIKASASS